VKKIIYVILVVDGLCASAQAPNPFGETVTTFADQKVKEQYETNINRYQKLSTLAQEVEIAMAKYTQNKTEANKNAYEAAVAAEHIAQQKYADQSKQNLEQERREKPPVTPTGTITCNGTIKPITPGSALSNQNLSGCTFDGTLTNISFTGTELQGAKFNMVLLKDVIFNDSNLTGITFSGSTLTNTQFNNTRLFFSNFIFVTAKNLTFNKARLQGANMSGSTFATTKFINECNVEQVDFTESQFNDVYFDQKSSVAHASFVNIRGTSLSFGTPYCTAPQPPLPSVSFMGFAGFSMTPSFEGATYYQPNLHMTNFNEAALGALCFLGNRTDPLNLIGASSINAHTQKVSFDTLYYDAPAIKLNKPLICECPAGKFMHNFMQAAKTGKCSPCKKEK